MSVLSDTIREMKAMAAEHSAVVIAFSGGKDSLTVLDLCRRFFHRIECFHFEFVETYGTSEADGFLTDGNFA